MKTPSRINVDGAKLRQLRTRLGMSQRSLAHRAGISRSYLTEIELDVRNPNAPTAYALAKCLGVETDEFSDYLVQYEPGSKSEAKRRGVYNYDTGKIAHPDS
jgi:transcriptional regulator with XRE-family HTH domain